MHACNNLQFFPGVDVGPSRWNLHEADDGSGDSNLASSSHPGSRGAAARLKGGSLTDIVATCRGCANGIWLGARKPMLMILNLIRDGGGT